MIDLTMAFLITIVRLQPVLTVIVIVNIIVVIVAVDWVINGYLYK